MFERRNHALRGWRSLALGLLLGVAAASPAAAIPALLQYQGQLTNGGGPVNGNVAMTFTLFGAESGGSPLWTESYASVTVTAGVFNVLLGSNTPLPVGSVFTGQTLWIETVIDGVTMTPRRPIVSVGYAARAAIADSAVAAPAAVPAGSVVYTRWGRTSCPPGASTVYSGYAASGYYSHTGGGRNLLCLTSTPAYGSFSDINQNGALIYGVEFETSAYGVSALAPLQNYDARCAVCLRENVRVSLMIPGANVCPAGWNLEYAGYLMATHYTQGASEFVCVDAAPEQTGSSASSDGHMWYPTETECGSLPCGPYVQDRELSCAVCTRP